MTDQATIDELANLLAEMSWFLGHQDDCGLITTPGCDTCTCGMVSLKARARIVYERVHHE